MEKNSIIKAVLIGILCALMIELIVIGIFAWEKNNTLSYFIVGNLITLLILIMTMYVDKKSENELKSKFDKIMSKLESLEKKIDKQSIHEPTVDKEK